MSKSETIQYRCISDNNICNYIDLISQIDFNHLIPENITCDLAIEKFHKILWDNYQICFPMKNRKINAKDKLFPWVTNDLKKSY